MKIPRHAEITYHPDFAGQYMDAFMCPFESREEKYPSRTICDMIQTLAHSPYEKTFHNQVSYDADITIPIEN